MANDIEIIPPSRRAVVTRMERPLPAPPREFHPTGIVSSRLAAWEENRRERVLTARASAVRAEAGLYDAQSQAINSFVKRTEALSRLAELPEILAHERSKRHTARTEELRELRHHHELSEEHRLTEIARVQTVRVAADQELQAQRDHGYVSASLKWKKAHSDVLEVELTMAERRAMLREHIGELEGGKQSAPLSDDDIDDELYQVRDHMRADGMDTGHVDAALARRKGRSNR
jgi:hypothetical protein